MSSNPIADADPPAWRNALRMPTGATLATLAGAAMRYHPGEDGAHARLQFESVMTRVRGRFSPLLLPRRQATPDLRAHHSFTPLRPAAAAAAAAAAAGALLIRDDAALTRRSCITNDQACAGHARVVTAQ